MCIVSVLRPNVNLENTYKQFCSGNRQHSLAYDLTVCYILFKGKAIEAATPNKFVVKLSV